MPTNFYNHWRDVPDTAWRWPNFSPAEIASRGDGKLLINEPALDKLQALRDRLGKPLIVRSAYRSPEHNRAVGGAKRSKHLFGAAFDIAMDNHKPVAFEAAAREVGFLGFGFYPRSGFMHVDLGPGRQWGERFAVRVTAFADEPPHAREVPVTSREVIWPFSEQFRFPTIPFFHSQGTVGVYLCPFDTSHHSVVLALRGSCLLPTP